MKTLSWLNVYQEIVLLGLHFCYASVAMWFSRAHGSAQVRSSCVIVDAKERWDLMKPSMEAIIEEKCHVSALFTESAICYIFEIIMFYKTLLESGSILAIPMPFSGINGFE